MKYITVALLLDMKGRIDVNYHNLAQKYLPRLVRDKLTALNNLRGNLLFSFKRSSHHRITGTSTDNIFLPASLIIESIDVFPQNTKSTFVFICKPLYKLLYTAVRTLRIIIVCQFCFG